MAPCRVNSARSQDAPHERRAIASPLAALALLAPGCRLQRQAGAGLGNRDRAPGGGTLSDRSGRHARVFVWGNPGLSDEVPVRPDGRISVPLLEDVQAADKTPTELAREIEQQLSAFVAGLWSR